MTFQLKPRKYGSIDFLRIPFKCDLRASLGLITAKLLVSVSAIAQIPLTAQFVDITIKAAQGKESIVHALVLFAFLTICIGYRRISFIISLFFAAHLETRAGTVLGSEFTKKRSKLHYRHYENQETWNLVNRVNAKPDQTISLMIQRVCNVMVYSTRIIGVLYIVYTQVWWIGMITCILCLPLAILSLKGGENNYKSTKKTARYDRRHQYLAEVLSGREAVDERTLFGFSEHLNKEWFRQYEESRKIKLNADLKMMMSVRGASIIATFFSSLITVLLIYPTINGHISIGMFVALATSMFDLISMVGVDMAKSFTQLSGFRGYLKDLTEFAALDEVENADVCPDTKEFVFESIEFDNVSFNYPGVTTAIIDKLSLKIEKGKHYAFVGANGAGKTTITKLMTGLYDNYSGQILVNGRDLKTLTQAELKSVFAGVYQDFAKYNLSVRENICIGNVNNMNDKQTELQMTELLRQLEIHNEVSSLPKGIDTCLGKISENGVDLSGGQWQKIAMARALINPAPVLILDEPTAALDPISESNLYGQFEKISQGKTTIFISHRLGATKLADTIFVLENGRIAEVGSHEMLMERNGIYTKMYESQRSWYQ